MSCPGRRTLVKPDLNIFFIPMDNKNLKMLLVRYSQNFLTLSYDQFQGRVAFITQGELKMKLFLKIRLFVQNDGCKTFVIRFVQFTLHFVMFKIQA
jgi:hypothetical protein